jgi:hypothetical protein
MVVLIRPKDRYGAARLVLIPAAEYFSKDRRRVISAEIPIASPHDGTLLPII